MQRRSSSLAPMLSAFLVMSCGRCGDDGGSGGTDGTQNVGEFSGLFDDVALGLNFPLDIAVVPDDSSTADVVEGGDVLVANYGTSEVLRVPNPSDATGVAAETLFDGTSAGLRGATAVSSPSPAATWAAFEQGGAGDAGGVAILDADGVLVTVLDGAVGSTAFARPGGLCWGGDAPGGGVMFFVVNMGDGTAWRIVADDLSGAGATFARVGAGLATGTAGSPGSPGAGLSNANQLPQGGARGCAYHLGALYVADAQNARVVRFDDADTGTDATPLALEDTPPDLVTFPTGVAVNEDGFLIIVSYDNAHAFVAVETPSGSFVDNGLHDLNVNAGNHAIALAHDTIWFTRANNQNGALRAVTPSQDVPPGTAGPFPPQ